MGYFKIFPRLPLWELCEVNQWLGNALQFARFSLGFSKQKKLHEGIFNQELIILQDELLWRREQHFHQYYISEHRRQKSGRSVESDLRRQRAHYQGAPTLLLCRESVRWEKAAEILHRADGAGFAMRTLHQLLVGNRAMQSLLLEIICPRDTGCQEPCS